MTSVAAVAGSTLLPRTLMAAPAQDPVVDTTQKAGKSVSCEKVPWKARPFPMKQVRLGEGPCKVAMEADRQYCIRCLPIACCTRFASTPAFRPPPSRLEDGKLPIVNCVVTMLAATIFLPVR